MNSTKALLIDLTMCIGCNSCQVACKKEYGLSDGEEKHLSASAFTALDEFDGTYVRRLCQHCLTPTCVSVCPVGAFTKSPEGPVLYTKTNASDADIACRHVRFRFPGTNGAARIHEFRNANFVSCAWPKVYNRHVRKFARPAQQNSEIVMTLIKEAHARIAAEPTKYIDKVYGLEESAEHRFFIFPVFPLKISGSIRNFKKRQCRC